jgi:hypothetical protein
MLRWHSSLKMKSKSSMGMAELWRTSFGGLPASAPPSSKSELPQAGVQVRLGTQHRIQLLDGCDDDVGDRVNAVGLQVLRGVQLGELAPVTRHDVLLELAQRLPPEVGAIHEEEHTPRAAVLDEARDAADGGVGLAAAGRHLDERAWPIPRQRLLKAGDSLHLALAQPLRQQRGQAAQSRA